jgi:Skp family chaperone for outer membrane proteins
MKASVLLAVVTLVPGMFLMQASGVSPVMVVDFDRAVASTPEGKDAITKLNAFGTEQRAAIDKKIKEAQEIENRLQSQGQVLSAAARTNLTRDLEAARSEIQTMGESAEKKMIEMQQQLLVPVEQKTRMAVSAYAAENSVKIVLDASTLQNGLLYVNDTADITTEIIRRIATDIRQGNRLDASLRSKERLLSRTWMNFDVAQRSLNAQ